MPSINIHEIDNTQYGLSGVPVDNIVYCPINTSVGPYEAKLIQSLDQFREIYGDTSPDANAKMYGMTSYDYAEGILLSGFPILCKRVEQSGISGKSKAQLQIPQGSGPAKTIISAESKTHGCYYNDKLLRFSVLNQSADYPLVVRIDVLKDSTSGTILETKTFYSKYLASDSKAWDDMSGQLRNPSAFNSFRITFVGEGATMQDHSFTFHSSFSGGTDITESEANNIILDAFASSKTSSIYAKYLGFLSDKYIYDVRFVTTGGFTELISTNDSTSIGTDDGVRWTALNRNIIDFCQTRQDCFGFVDIPYGLNKDVVRDKFIGTFDSTYAAAYAPWCYEKLYDGSYAWMPPSYVFLTNLAQSAKNTPVYYPPAGVNRMRCRRTLKPEYEVGASLLASWQNDDSLSINPIMSIRNYGYAIYGQRTLANNTSPVFKSSLKSVTVRFAAIQIKKAIFNTCIALTFEQNILRTWNEFKSNIETTLLEMKKNGAINSYMVLMDRSTISESDLANNIARGIVRVAINDAVENFDISFEISPSYVNFDDENQSIAVSNELENLF